MKQILLLALMGFCTCLSMGCKNNTAGNNPQTANQQQSTAKPQTADDVKTRVEAIYKDVSDTYNKANTTELAEGMEMLKEKDFDRDYCSEAWNKTLAKVLEKDNQHPDEIGFFDYDYWVMGQDFADFSATDVKVVDFKDGKATVKLNLHNCGSVTPLTLRMVYERDNWFIDDFITVYEGQDDSLRADMEEYLK